MDAEELGQLMCGLQENSLTCSYSHLLTGILFYRRSSVAFPSKSKPKQLSVPIRRVVETPLFFTVK